MKRLIVLLAVLLCAALLSGCGADGGSTGNEKYFTAMVLEVHENSVLVAPAADSDEIRSADRIDVGLSDEEGVWPDMQPGDVIRIAYNGQIAESYSAQIFAFSVTVEQRAADGGTAGGLNGEGGVACEVLPEDADTPKAEASSAPEEGVRPDDLPKEPLIEKGVQFYGTVTEAGEDYLLVEPEDGKVRLTPGPEGTIIDVEVFHVLPGEFDLSPFTVGMRVAVTYSGASTHGIPPQITAMDIFELNDALTEGMDGDPAGYSPSGARPARCVMVHGRLYYDTGKEPDPSPTCGTLDGTFSQIPEDEIPSKDGEANFAPAREGDFGYQNWDKNTICVPTKDGWRIFEAQ